MISVNQAQQSVLEAVDSLYDDPQIEQIPLSNALGRVLAKDVVSSIDVPPQDNSAMDGFAVKASDVVVGNTMKVSQRVTAGHVSGAIENASAARIFTGGAIPAGANGVIIQENCEYQTGATYMTPMQEVSQGDNIRRRGQDIKIGTCIVSKGSRLTAVDLGLIASVGQAQVSVWPKIKVAIFSTGDELIEPGDDLAEGQIYNSNRVMLSALCTQLGLEVVDCGIVEDTLTATKQALLDASESADVILSSGGVSVGEEDHVKPALESLGKLSMWKVQMKPGKPVVFGELNQTPFLGLPGNPVSSFIVFQLLAVPLLQKRQGQAVNQPACYQVISDFDKQLVTREEYIRAKLVKDENGEYRVARFENLSSGVLSSLAWADGLIRQNAGCEIISGQAVDYLPLNFALL